LRLQGDRRLARRFPTAGPWGAIAAKLDVRVQVQGLAPDAIDPIQAYPTRRTSIGANGRALKVRPVDLSERRVESRRVSLWNAFHTMKSSAAQPEGLHSAADDGAAGACCAPGF
jgi:hypothetical protein